VMRCGGEDHAHGSVGSKSRWYDGTRTLRCVLEVQAERMLAHVDRMQRAEDDHLKGY